MMRHNAAVNTVMGPDAVHIITESQPSMIFLPKQHYCSKISSRCKVVKFKYCDNDTSAASLPAATSALLLSAWILLSKYLKVKQHIQFDSGLNCNTENFYLFCLKSVITWDMI